MELARAFSMEMKIKMGSTFRANGETTQGGDMNVSLQDVSVLVCVGLNIIAHYLNLVSPNST